MKTGVLARPVLLTFVDVRIDVHDIAYPFASQWTDYEVSSQLAGGSQKGSIHATGKTNFLNEETKVNTVLKNIDLALLKPYIEKKGDAGIERGFINMNMDAGVVKKHIKAPGDNGDQGPPIKLFEWRRWNLSRCPEIDGAEFLKKQ